MRPIAGLSCAAWSPSLAYKQVVAGYDDGTLVVYSLRNPNAPNATLLVNPYAHGPRRPLRAMRWAAAASADGGGARPALFVVGGTAREQLTQRLGGIHRHTPVPLRLEALAARLDG